MKGTPRNSCSLKRRCYCIPFSNEKAMSTLCQHISQYPYRIPIGSTSIWTKEWIKDKTKFPMLVTKKEYYTKYLNPWWLFENFFPDRNNISAWLLGDHLAFLPVATKEKKKKAKWHSSLILLYERANISIILTGTDWLLFTRWGPI